MEERLNTYYQEKADLMLKQNKQKGWQQILGRKKTLRQQIVAHQVEALLQLLSDLWGAESFTLQAKELGVLNSLHSKRIQERALALKKLVYRDAALKLNKAEKADLNLLIKDVEEKITDLIAQKTLGELEAQVMKKMQDRHEDYLNEVRLQIIKERSPNPENAQTLKN